MIVWCYVFDYENTFLDIAPRAGDAQSCSNSISPLDDGWYGGKLSVAKSLMKWKWQSSSLLIPTPTGKKALFSTDE